MSRHAEFPPAHPTPGTPRPPYLPVVFLIALSPVSAHEFYSTKLTWSRDVSRIVYKRCAGCHHEGGKAPMSLLDYAEARPWAKAIKEEVLERRMPPWGPVKGYGEFRDDRGLSQDEISIIAEWVEGGAPEGETKFLPERPRFDAPPAAQSKAAETPLKGALRLRAKRVFRGIQPADLTGEPLRVWAEKPDGSVEPLLWLYKYKPDWRFPYYFSSPIALPKGSEIKVEPASAGTLVLFE